MAYVQSKFSVGYMLSKDARVTVDRCSPFRHWLARLGLCRHRTASLTVLEWLDTWPAEYRPIVKGRRG